MAEHEWIELTTLDDLPERVWMCNHCTEQRREVASPDWLANKPLADRRFYESLGLQVISHPLGRG